MGTERCQASSGDCAGCRRATIRLSRAKHLRSQEMRVGREVGLLRGRQWKHGDCWPLRGVADATVIDIASSNREHFSIRIGASYRSGCEVQERWRWTRQASISGRKYDVGSEDGKNPHKNVERVKRIIDEASRLPRRNVLLARVEDSPT